MKLTGLKPLYISIKRNNLTYGIFKYQVNKVSFEIFFDISTIPYQLGFIQRQSTFQLSFVFRISKQPKITRNIQA